MDSSHDTLNNAVALHGQGRLEEAIVLYQQVLAFRPDDVTVTANLASAFVKTGRQDDGLRLYRELSSRGDNSPEFWFNFANALQRAGEYLEARQAFERALHIAPQFFPAALNLANLVRDQNETDEAVTLYRRAILMKPEHSKPRVNLARLLREHKRLEETCEVLDAGLRYSPGSVDLLYERAAAGYEAGDSETAFAACRRILKQQPKHGNAHTLVGLVEYERGNVDQAVRWWSELARIEPNNSEPHINLGTLRQKEWQLEQAVGHFREAVRRDPVDLGANLKLGLILSTTGHVSEAMQIGRRLTKQFAERPEGYSLLANGFHEQGLCEEARTTFNEALSKKAEDTVLIGNALFSSLYSDTLTDEEILNVHQQLSLRLHELAVQHDQPVPAPARPRDAETRIRVGYLSPDLRMHPVGYFIEPVLMHHDRSAFEVICYSDNGSADDLTARLRKLDLTWHDCSAWDDVRLEEQMRSDQLDLLIDLTGHTVKNRSMVLARKPAPRLATYLGYPGKTERPANDWLIADHDVCPIEMPIDSQEKVVRLPSCFLCYQPQTGTPEVALPPFDKNGFVTFGSFNHLAKLTDSTVNLWSRVLHAVPNSRLVIKALPLADVETRQLTKSRFNKCGIDPERVDTLPPTVPLSAFLGEYSRMDVGLDTVPYNGGTTTCDALWMGVPVVTLPGSRFCSRMGVSVLRAVGLDECVARNADDFVRIAQELASDTVKLSKLRSTLRNQVARSSLGDAAGFTRGFEAVLREITL